MPQIWRNFVSNDDVNINVDWHNWKDALLVAVKDHIPKKKLKGRNPLPWINRPIINFKKRKRNTLVSPSSYLRSKFRDLRSAVKCRIREARDSFFSQMKSDFRSNPERFWLILKLKSKHRNVLGVISTAAEDGRRISATSSREIV